MQAAGHKALQEMNNEMAAKVNNTTSDIQGVSLPTSGNYTKSFVRVQAVIKAYIMQHNPSGVIFSADGLPAKLFENEDKDDLLNEVVRKFFVGVIEGKYNNAVLDFVFEYGQLSTMYTRIEGDELLASLTIEGDLIPCVTHTMYDLSELASLYNINKNESLADVKQKVALNLDKEDDVTYYDLDHDYLECLVEREA